MAMHYELETERETEITNTLVNTITDTLSALNVNPSDFNDCSGVIFGLGIACAIAAKRMDTKMKVDQYEALNSMREVSLQLYDNIEFFSKDDEEEAQAVTLN